MYWIYSTSSIDTQRLITQQASTVGGSQLVRPPSSVHVPITHVASGTVGIGALRHLEPKNDWSKLPAKEWIRSAVKITGSDTGGVTNVVTSEFLNRWNVGKSVDLTQVSMWETPHPQRVQPAGSIPIPLPGTGHQGFDGQSPSRPVGFTSFPTNPVPSTSGTGHMFPHPGIQVVETPSTPIMGLGLTESPKSSLNPLPSVSGESGSPLSDQIAFPALLDQVPENPQIASLVQSVVGSRRVDDHKALIIGHGAVISASDLLGIVKKLFKNVGRDQGDFKEAVFDFVCTWVLGEFLDVSFFSEVLGFVNKYLATSPTLSHRQEMYRLQGFLGGQISPRSRTGSTNGSIASSASSNSPGKPRKLHEKSLSKMKEADFVELAKALVEMELENRIELSIPLAVRSLKNWQDNPLSMEHEPFSPLADKVSQRFMYKIQHGTDTQFPQPDTNMGQRRMSP